MTPNLKFVDTSLLRVAYEEWNPTGNCTVVLLHGWPDSIRSWSEVAPGLAQAGWRVLVPALRGFLPTRFFTRGHASHGSTRRARVRSAGVY